MSVSEPENRRVFPGWFWAILLILGLGGAAWFLLGPAPLGSDVPSPPSPPTGTSASPVGPSSASPQDNPPPPPDRRDTAVVLGRLVEPGGFIPHRTLLYATRIFAAGAPKDGLVPTEDGGFSFYPSDPAAPITLDIRTGFHAILGSRVLVEESASRRVEHAGAAEGRKSVDLGEIVLPSPERLASLFGVVQSGAGGAVEAVGVRLTGLEEIEGRRLEAVDNRHVIGHPPNVPARYVQDAKFLVRHIPPGAYELEVRARGHRTFRKNVEVVAGGPLAAMTVILSAAPMVEGTITDGSTGEALSHAEIRLHAGPRTVGEATSDDHGRFHITLEEEVQDEEIRLSVARRGYEKTDVLLPVRRLSLARPLDQPVVLKSEPKE